MTNDPKGTDPARARPAALETRSGDGDARRFSPSVARNRDAIGEVFRTHMPHAGTVLEIASGTGEHGAHIAPGLDQLNWWYSDIDDEGLASQAAWAAHFGPGSGLKGPLALDVTQAGWHADKVPAPLDAIFCANMIHIAPFAAAEGLIEGAGQLLASGGRLMVYGPFARDGEIAPSNAGFNESLKARNPAWGVRDLDRDIVPLASAAGLVLAEVISMPASNLSVIFQRRGA